MTQIIFNNLVQVQTICLDIQTDKLLQYEVINDI